ncbi:MAG TPA: molybdate ABC transporter substrate-binding protein [Pyrinomonadaceae bacterium]
MKVGWLAKRVAILLTLLPVLSLFACQDGRPEPSKQSVQSSEANEIIVAAAANLTGAFGELRQAFTSQTGIRVTYSFGATTDLARQIENGAPFDVFASADVKNVEALEGKGLLTEGTRAVYARGRLVLWLPPHSRVSLNRIEDLTRADVTRIALAKPDLAPYGEAAVETLRSLKVWTAVEPKVVYGQNVSQAKQFASTGNVDAAFIPRSLVKANEGRAIDVDESLHQPIRQSIGVVRASTKQEEARRFVEFVLSPAGQTLLERYGYARADAR